MYVCLYSFRYLVTTHFNGFTHLFILKNNEKQNAVNRVRKVVIMDAFSMSHNYL